MPDLFKPEYLQAPKEKRESLGKVAENTLKHHEFEHARHFYKGFDSYPLDKFYNQQGDLNETLFMAVSELLAYQNELKMIRANKNLKHTAVARNPILLVKEASMYYPRLFDPQVLSGQDPQFATLLQERLHPDKLFK